LNASWFRLAGIVSVGLAAGALVACSTGDIDEGQAVSGSELESVAPDNENASIEDDYGEAAQALMSCSNPDGTNSVMAAFAVAVAQELGRWNASKDFVMNSTSGRSESSPGAQQAIKLASGSDANGPIGKSRCSDGRCARVQALLDMQYDQANNQIYIQGSGSTKVLLSPAALRSRMYAKWQEQKACDQNARDGDNNSCTREQNSLQYLSSAKGGCDTNFTFGVKGANGAPLHFPNQLKNQLKFADWTNPYINFQNLGNGKISIDPTYGLDEDSSTTTGACNAACTVISRVDKEGSCCSCGGVTRTLKKLPFNSSIFKCS
jgi:hypothetical protein